MTLREYLAVLERHGELLRISVPVDAEYEAGELAQRAMRQGAPALLFENVKGSAFPLAMNLNGTKRRLELGLGMDPEALGARLIGFVKDMQPPSLKALWRHRSTVARALNMRVRRVGSSPVQDVVESQP